MAANELVDAIVADDRERALGLLRERPQLARAADEAGVSALMLALYRGAGDVADAVRAARPELDVFEAAALGDVEQLRLLLRDPGLAAAWSPDGFTALHFAAFFGQPEAARVLVEHGADLEAPSRNEQLAPQARPLHSAAAGRRLDVCAVLLEAGADPNARQHGGYTPLLEAAQNADEELAALLLEHAADASLALDDGRDAAALAEAAGAGELAERLRAAAPPVH